MRAYRRGALCDDNPLLDRGAGQSARWMLSFVWVAGLAAGVGLNCYSFISMGGLEAVGCKAGEVPHMYLVHWWHDLVHVANPLGLALGAGICALPFAVELFMLPRAVDEERLLPYHVGVVSCFTGVLAFAQLAMLSPLWFWNWSSAIKMHSPFFLQALVLCAAGTLTCALTVFGSEAACRDYDRLRRSRARSLNQQGRFVLFSVFILVLAAGVLPGRFQRGTRIMLGVIDDFAREVVAECGGVHRIFTDGAYDARLELLAAERGHALYALSMLDRGGAYAQHLRLRGKLDVDDKLALGAHANGALRSWVREKKSMLSDVAVQWGVENWKHLGLPLPMCAGVVARPAGMTDAECAQGVANARELAKRIFSVYRSGGLAKSASSRFCELFRRAQWRIARIARIRAERADAAGDVQAAEADTKFSEELDDLNSECQRILADMEHARKTMLNQITPREGLQLALARADFALAASYARPILKANKEDPEANFGMAMSYYVQKQWARSEEHFKTYLKQRPKEPAAWNNLALACMQMNRFTEAEQHAQKALALLPDSTEVRDTVKQIAAAKQAVAEKAAKAAKKGVK